MTKQAIREGFERLRPGDAALAPRGRRAVALRGRLAGRHERDPRGDDPRPRLGRRGRLARPGADADARDDRQARARDPGLRPGALLARARHLRPALRRTLVRGRRDAAEGRRPRRRRSSRRSPGRKASVESVERKEQSERPPLLYDLTSLQRDANRRFGFSARRTLQAAQSLYEARRRSRTRARLAPVPLRRPRPPSSRPSPHPWCRSRSTPPPRATSSALDQLPLGRVVNDAKVDDHHAIIPTDDRSRRLGLLARTSAASSTSSRGASSPSSTRRRATQRTTIVTEVESERFRTRGKVTLEAGWRGVYGVEADADKERQDEEGEGEGVELPALEQGQKVVCAHAESEAKETRPPPRYTEATLLSAMETAGKLIDDEELREAMKDSRARHAGHSRGDDRDADPARVRRARGQGSPGRRRRACR